MGLKKLYELTFVFAVFLAACFRLSVQAGAGTLVLVEEGRSLAPVVVFEGAPPRTMEAARELAEYIGKVSGARPEVVEGRPGSLPERAIWVGYQEVLEELFPGLDFEFKHHEEILIAANESHLVIAGRDKWDPDAMRVEVQARWQRRTRYIEDFQQEYGTANAVYTFIQEYLDVRWLWPGELGEDIITSGTIAFEPFEYRYHPQFRQRADVFLRSSPGSREGRSGDGRAHEWSRRQRLKLDSMRFRSGHAFSDWWDRFSETNPEYFALQPDGTRSGHPRPRHAKLCQSNPDVWEEWLRDVEHELHRNPHQTAFNASPNDAAASGICICEDCRSWDHPDGGPHRYRWDRFSQEYVAMTDRYVTFWNTLAGKLKERYPDREFYVQGWAYGPSLTPPVGKELEENIIIGYVGRFPFRPEPEREAQKAEWEAWSRHAHLMIFRPNLFYNGGVWGLPEVAMRKTMEDFRFIAENRCMGLIVDGFTEHWSVKGPQLYLMARLAWDPYLDGGEVMAEYYRRGFGEAAGEVEEYWRMMEEAHHGFMNSPDYTFDVRPQIRILREQVYTDEFLDRVQAVLDRAAAKVEGVHRERVEFVRDGLDFTRLMMENVSLMDRVRETGGRDAEAVSRVMDNWDAIEAIGRKNPYGIHYVRLLGNMLLDWYRAGVSDYFGPPNDEFLEAAGLEPRGDARARYRAAVGEHDRLFLDGN